MVEYRVYEIGEDEHIRNYRAFACEGDADAMVWAKQLLDGNDIELWSGKRFVIRPWWSKAAISPLLLRVNKSARLSGTRLSAYN
jgi:hypothetical protein